MSRLHTNPWVCVLKIQSDERLGSDGLGTLPRAFERADTVSMYLRKPFDKGSISEKNTSVYADCRAVKPVALGWKREGVG